MFRQPRKYPASVVGRGEVHNVNSKFLVFCVFRFLGLLPGDAERCTGFKEVTVFCLLHPGFTMHYIALLHITVFQCTLLYTSTHYSISLQFTDGLNIFCLYTVYMHIYFVLLSDLPVFCATFRNEGLSIRSTFCHISQYGKY